MRLILDYVQVHSMLQRSSRALLRAGSEAEAISTLEVLFQRRCEPEKINSLSNLLMFVAQMHVDYVLCRFIDGSKNAALKKHLRGLVGYDCIMSC